jgi:hypothetical protein
LLANTNCIECQDYWHDELYSGARSGFVVC